MATDFNKPVVTDAYATLLPGLVTANKDLARMLEPTLTGTSTNIPTGAVRWNAATIRWERYNGTSWVTLPAAGDNIYAISISGNAATATSATTAAACSGNAATATKLATARTIGGVSFDGSANINLPGVNSQGNQNTTGNAANLTPNPAGYTHIGEWEKPPSAANTFLVNRAYMSDTCIGNAATATTANGLNAANSYAMVGLTVGNGQANSTITMSDSDEGARSIHCNSNNIGFLTQASSWGAWCDDNGNWTAAGNVTAYSDARLKTNLEVIPDALVKVQQLTGYTYTRTDSGARQTGVIAQDLQKVLPEAVMDDGEYLSVAYGNIVGLLIEAVKELKAEVDALKAGRN